MTKLIDEDRLDLDALIDRSTDATVYPTDMWIDTVASNIEYDGGAGAFDPDDYDDEREWMIDELAALLVRAHRETDLDLLAISGSLKSIDDQIINVADIGVTSYANSVGRGDEFDQMPDAETGGGFG